MRRREFVVLLGGAAVAWPLSARAQQRAMPVIGFLNPRSPESAANLVEAFRRGLSEIGFFEGRNVLVEFRWAHGQYDLLPKLAADLAAHHVTLIVTGPVNAALAAKSATSTIPIVFTSGVDPVDAGLVTSLNRPGGNLTGVSLFSMTLLAKRLDLMHAMMPKADVIAILMNPNNANAAVQSKTLHAAALALGLRPYELGASTEQDIDSAFTTLNKRGASALFVTGDPFFNSRRDQIVSLAADHAIPSIYEYRDFAEAGGLMSYGTSLTDSFRQVGVYAGRILKGEKPANLPVIQPTKFELVINLKTAKALSLEIPPTLLALADEVIE
jgi:putative ABC transport system substrate-binding protein